MMMERHVNVSIKEVDISSDEEVSVFTYVHDLCAKEDGKICESYWIQSVPNPSYILMLVERLQNYNTLTSKIIQIIHIYILQQQVKPLS